MILLFAMAARTPLDSDMWWHLRAGEETWRARQPVITDTFSYTRYGERWINHSWLSQVGMYLLFKFGGYLTLGAMMALLATLSMFFVYLQMDIHPILRGLVLVFAALVAAKVWSPRPQLVSLVMFGAVGYILYLFKWRKQNFLWILPIVFVLWSNLHGGYVLGLLLIGSMIGGELINHLLGLEARESLTWRGIRQLVLWELVGALVVVINPNGFAMWTIALQTIRVEVLQQFVSEWASPDFHDISQQPFIWLLLATLGAAGVSSKRLDGSDLVAVSGFAYLALVARRNYGPFAMVAAPILSRHLEAILAGWHERRFPRWAGVTNRPGIGPLSTNSRPLSPRISKAVNLFVITVLGTAALMKLLFVTNPTVVENFERRAFPVEAVAWIRDNGPPGRLFNAYNWGGYLVMNLPEYLVFVDGRTDLFNDEVLEEWLDVVNAKEGWQHILDKWNVNLLLLQPDMKIVDQLSNKGWQLVYSDQLAVVYVR
jgi:hypothetical protein